MPPVIGPGLGRGGGSTHTRDAGTLTSLIVTPVLGDPCLGALPPVLGDGSGRGWGGALVNAPYLGAHPHAGRGNADLPKGNDTRAWRPVLERSA